MSHQHTVIEPAAGLTVLVGPNNCGKSAIVTALQILCHNDNSTYVLRHGAKECRIIVETEEGNRIEWIRKKSGSPSYLINGQEFDRLNKKDCGVWDELKKTLRLPRVEFDNSKFDVHIGEQRNPVFLLGDKGKGAAQFFASSSDAIKLVEMQDRHKKNVRENKKERGRLELQQTQVSEALDCLEAVPKLNEQLDESEAQFAVLESGEAKAKRLAELVSELTQQQRDAKRFAAVETALGALPKPPQFDNPLPLQNLVDRIQVQQLEIRESSSLRDAFQTLAPPPEFGDLKTLDRVIGSIRKQEKSIASITRFQKILAKVKQPPQLKESETVSMLAQRVVKIRTELETCSELQKKLAKISGQLSKTESAIHEWATENPSCPTCGNEIDAETLLTSGGHQHG